MVSQNNCKKGCPPVGAWTDTYKNPKKCIWCWEADWRYNFFFILPAHLCTVPYITETPLHVTLNNQSHFHSLIKIQICGIQIKDWCAIHSAVPECLKKNNSDGFSFFYIKLASYHIPDNRNISQYWDFWSRKQLWKFTLPLLLYNIFQQIWWQGIFILRLWSDNIWQDQGSIATFIIYNIHWRDLMSRHIHTKIVKLWHGRIRASTCM